MLNSTSILVVNMTGSFMSNNNYKIKRFADRLQKTYQRFGYVSLDSIVKSYYEHRTEYSNFTPFKQHDYVTVSYHKTAISPQRLNQMLSSLEKANAAKKSQFI
ncbi:hypothetical protein A6E04_04575 [Aliivibrio logei]|uniref:Uncharacterized protein n=1 Tax=Aliivibrio logei TaxID=688 RepID=A0A1B9P3Z2_ALILO|nr:hypothetical protein A6E04_04575 [Aliivibrio logei]